MDWRLVSETLRLLRAEARFLYASYQRRVHLALALVVLSRAWRPWLRRWLLRLHHARHAAPPRLVFQPSPLSERLLAHCKVLQSAYHAPWYLSNGHLQTLYLGGVMRSRQPVIHYERQIVEMPDGGIVSLDWALPPREDGSIPTLQHIDPGQCTMIILPGLTGGSDEFYIRSLVHEMHKYSWQVVVLNARGCAGTPLRTPQLFSCAYTGDLRFVLELLRDTYNFVNSAALVAVGFSMGSNVLVKYLGEYQEDALVTAAASVGNPFDMAEASRTMKKSFLYRNTYYAALTLNLKALFFDKSNAHEAFRDHPVIDLDAVRNASGIDDFDEKLTCIVFGYKDAHEYYTDASCSYRIANVRVPLLCINAEDDPICATHAIPLAAIRGNPHVLLCLTKGGGHLAFYESDHAQRDEPSHAPPRVWSSRAVAEFADSFRVAVV